MNINNEALVGLNVGMMKVGRSYKFTRQDLVMLSGVDMNAVKKAVRKMSCVEGEESESGPVPQKLHRKFAPGKKCSGCSFETTCLLLMLHQSSDNARFIPEYILPLLIME